MAPTKNIVFDVVGTCVSYDAFFAGIQTHLGPRLLSAGISPKLFGFAWMESAEREYTYFSISGRYRPFNEVFRALFYRVLWMAGVEEPREFATDEQRDAVLVSYAHLGIRDGVKESFELLRRNGFVVWCFTSGDVGRVRGYFVDAGIDMPVGNFKSCDTEGVAKPALKAYDEVFKQFDEGDAKWFAAAHMWDVSAAKAVGFHGAYCSIYEKESCADLFNVEMDVVDDTIFGMAEKIVEMSC